jgi:hypothetical protein
VSIGVGSGVYFGPFHRTKDSNSSEKPLFRCEGTECLSVAGAHLIVEDIRLCLGSASSAIRMTLQSIVELRGVDIVPCATSAPASATALVVESSTLVLRNVTIHGFTHTGAGRSLSLLTASAFLLGSAFTDMTGEVATLQASSSSILASSVTMRSLAMTSRNGGAINLERNLFGATRSQFVSCEVQTASISKTL